MSKSKQPVSDAEKYAQQILNHYAERLAAGAVYFDARTGERLTDLSDVIYALDAEALRTEPVSSNGKR
jgi:hypothetical protein